jgi:hypothetical protein
MKTPKILLEAIILTVTSNVRAHDWYPKECCCGHDCAPATVEPIPVTPALAQQLQTTPPSAMMITTKHGTVIVPSGFKARESKDGRAHACITKLGAG